jgi:ligand-binding sensor domain-containing protein
MKRIIIQWAGVLIIVVLLPGRVSAQLPFIVFKTLAPEISGASVQAIMQDSTGFMWIGTHAHLYRYNGYSCRVFQHAPEDSTSLTDGSIMAIYQDT